MSSTLFCTHAVVQHGTARPAFVEMRERLRAAFLRVQSSVFSDFRPDERHANHDEDCAYAAGYHGDQRARGDGVAHHGTEPVRDSAGFEFTEFI